jgi:peroxiredoxin Q/BCP
MLEAGIQAPDFELKNQDDKTIKLSNYKGQFVVLYFYPRDDTPGCTTEACGFRDNLPALKKLKAVVLGVSTDDVETHKKFQVKYDLPFNLLVDTDKTVHQAYGTWVEKSMYGRTYWGAQRATFVVDKEGMIRHVFPKVKPEGHAEEVKAVLDSLK